MKKILDLMEQKLKAAFTACGYEDKFAKVVLSNRPDLCEYQCNGAMAAAKAYKTKPIDIANAVVEKLTAEREQPMFGEAVAVMPGFINLKLSEAFLADYMKGMAEADKLGLEEPEKKETIIVITAALMWQSPSCGPSAFCYYRREHQAHGPFYGI